MKDKEITKMAKTLFERAINIRTDNETLLELQYLKETLPYAGYEPEDLKEKMDAINYILKRYGKR